MTTKIRVVQLTFAASLGLLWGLLGSVFMGWIGGAVVAFGVTIFIFWLLQVLAAH